MGCSRAVSSRVCGCSTNLRMLLVTVCSSVIAYPLEIFPLSGSAKCEDLSRLRPCLDSGLQGLLGSIFSQGRLPDRSLGMQNFALELEDILADSDIHQHQP